MSSVHHERLAHQDVDGYHVDAARSLHEVIWRVDVGPGVRPHAELGYVGRVTLGDAQPGNDVYGGISRPDQEIRADRKRDVDHPFGLSHVGTTIPKGRG
jgi:hypothetical protein